MLFWYYSLNWTALSHLSFYKVSNFFLLLHSLFMIYSALQFTPSKSNRNPFFSFINSESKHLIHKLPFQIKASNLEEWWRYYPCFYTIDKPSPIFFKRMEWATVHHLDLRHVGRGFHKPLQPHAAAFHPAQTLIAAAIGTYIIGNYLGFWWLIYAFF